MVSITWEFLLATFNAMNQPWLPMAFSVKKLGFIPQWLVFGSISMFCGILSVCDSHNPVMFFHFFLHGFSL